jgi:lipopolysaccharide export system permease protein
MILYRYLLKDIFSHTVAVSLVFLFVVLSSRSIQYLEQVTRGELSSELVFWVILFRLPEFLELIIPFSFFLALVLVIGRICSDNEMIILEQNGFSNSRLLKLFLSSGLLIAFITGFLSFWVSPFFKENLDKIYQVTNFEDNFNSIQPGKFVILDDRSVIFAQDKEDNILSNIFLKLPEQEGTPSRNFLTAKRSYISKENPNLLLFEDGLSFNEDKTNQIEMQFESLSMNFRNDFFRNQDVQQVDLTKVKHSSLEKLWQISIPLLCLISVVLALPLSRVKPRQGRYAKILPSIFVFMTYLGLLLLVKGWIEEGSVTFPSSLLLVHAFFFLLGLFLLFRLSRLRG